LLAALGADARARITDVPVFVPHARIAAHAQARGLRTVIHTPGSDAGLIAGLLEWFAGHTNTRRS